MSFRAALVVLILLGFAVLLALQAAAAYLGWLLFLLLAAAIAVGYQGAKVWRGGPP